MAFLTGKECGGTKCCASTPPPKPGEAVKPGEIEKLQQGQTKHAHAHTPHSHSHSHEKEEKKQYKEKVKISHEIIERFVISCGEWLMTV